MQQKKYSDINISSLITGLFLGVILNFALVYASLTLGFSLGGSTIAALMGMLIFKLILKKSLTKVQLNSIQTISSSIVSAGIGVAFVLPAVLYITKTSFYDISLAPFFIASLAGVLAGVVLIVPFRVKFIDHLRLQFPTGGAVAFLINNSSVDKSKSWSLFSGIIVGLCWYLLFYVIGGVGPLDLFNITLFKFSSGVAVEISISLLVFAIGLIIGKNGVTMLIISIVLFFIILPFSPVLIEKSYVHLQATQLRPLAMGIMVSASLMLLVNFFRSIELSSLRRSVLEYRQEISLNLFVFTLIISFLLLVWSLILTNISLLMIFVVASLALFISFIGTLIVSFATGISDISPVSAFSILTFLFFHLLFSLPFEATISLTLFISVAIAAGSDMMQDLKTGHIIGARPIIQQRLQLATSWIGVVLAFVSLYVLSTQNLSGSLAAPQAHMLAQVYQMGVSSVGHYLDGFYYGNALGVVLTFMPIPSFAMMTALALFLPLSTLLALGFGSLVTVSLKKMKGYLFVREIIRPFASGIIVSWALTCFVFFILHLIGAKL